MKKIEGMKRALSMLLSIVMVFGMLPVPALAAEETPCSHSYVEGICSACGEAEPVVTEQPVTETTAPQECLHSGGSATCQAPAVCEVCGESYGEPAAHSYTEGVCICGTVCAHSYADGVCAVCGAQEPAAEKTCSCESDDPVLHATFCDLYVAPAEPSCTCGAACSAEFLNAWCDICGIQGADACRSRDEAALYSGSCGDNASWDLSGGVLTISGTGAMSDFEYENGTGPLTPWYASRDSITSIVVNDGITYIGEYAFLYLGKVTSVSLPDTVTGIGETSFAYMDSLTSITLPKDLKTIPKGMFMQSSALESVVIPSGVTCIDLLAFWYCSAMTEVTIPFSVTEIAESSFADCTALESIYYGGTAEDWANVTIGGSNSALTRETTTYYYAQSVTLPSGTGYTVAAVEGSASPVVYGNSFSFTVTPAEGYVKGAGFKVSANGTALTESGGVYTISNITAPQTVTVEGMVEAADYQITINSAKVTDGNLSGTCWNYDPASNVLYLEAGFSGQIISKRDHLTIEVNGRVDSSGISATAGTLTLRGKTGKTADTLMVRYGRILVMGSQLKIEDLYVDVKQDNLAAIAVGASDASSYATCTGCLTIEDARVEGWSSGEEAFCGIDTGTIHVFGDSYVYGRSNRPGLPGIDASQPGSIFSSECHVEATSKTGPGLSIKSVTVPEYAYIYKGGVSGTTSNYLLTKTSEVFYDSGYSSSRDFEFIGLDHASYRQNADGATHSLYCDCGSYGMGDKISCSGGEANCDNKAVCTGCGSGYGELGDHLYSFTADQANAKITAVCGQNTEHTYTLTLKAPTALESDGTAKEAVVEGTIEGVETPEIVYTGNTTGGKPVLPGDYTASITLGNATVSVSFTLTSRFPTGSCGTNVTWEFNTDTGVLTISGTGAVADHGSSNPVPWSDYCKSITGVVIEEGITTIGSYTFSGCTAMQSVTIPTTLKSTKYGAFRNCNALTAVNITDLAKWCSIAFNHSDGNPLEFAHSLYVNGEKITDLVIPAGVTEIGLCTFIGGDFESITIPGNVTFIDAMAFYNCKNATNLDLSGSVWTISDFAFYGCTGLTNVVIPEGVKNLGEYAFAYCSNLRSIYIPDSVTSIKSCSIVIEGAINGSGFKSLVTGCPEDLVIFCEADAKPSDWYNKWNYLDLNTPVTTYWGVKNAPAAMPASVSIQTLPDTTRYIVGDTIDLKGLTLLAQDASGKTWTVATDDGISILSGNTSAAGVIPVTVSYFGKSAEFDIIVHEGISGRQLQPSSKYPESDHSYSNHCSKSWTYTCEGALSLELKFSSQTTVESGYDYIYIYDGAGTQLGKYTGTQLAGQTVLIQGDTVKIKLTSDGTTVAYGFSLSSIYGIFEREETHEAADEGIYTEPTCTEDGFTTHTCFCGETFVETDAGSAGHKPQTVPGKDATCTEDGLTEGSSCSACGEVIIAQIVVPATGHSEVIDKAVAATCTTDGKTEGKHCSVCDKVIDAQETIPAVHSVVGKICYLCESYGKCGENVFWDCDGYTLRFSGTGDMENYNIFVDVPWREKFIEWGKIREVIISEGITSIGDYACYELDMPSITIPESVTRIGKWAFAHCWKMTSIIIPKRVTSIDEIAFSDMNLKTIIFTGNAPDFNSYIFSGTTATAYYPAGDPTWTSDKLQGYGGTITWEVICPDCLDVDAVAIDKGVEATCTTDGLTEGKHCSACGEVLIAQETIPGAHIIENGICTRCGVYGTCGENLVWTFDSSSGRLTISGNGEMEVFANNAPWYTIRQDILSVVVEDGVKSVSPLAFFSCENVMEITLPDSVTNIGMSAFRFCSSLKQIRLPANLTIIESNLFSGCSGLETISLPKGITRLGESAFNGCAKLKTITIPSGVTHLDKWALSGCWEMTKIVFTGNAPTIVEDAFTWITGTAYYPAGNPTWTSDKLQNYGGTITWVAKSAIPDAPVIAASNQAGSGKPSISWTAVENATQYRVYRSTSQYGTYSLIGTTDITSYTNSGAVAGTLYYYKVTAVSASGNASAFSNLISRTCDLPRPVLTTGNSATSGKPTISWSAIEGAKEYKVYRSTSQSGTYSLINTTTDTTYTNTGAVVGTTYYYKVMAIHSNSAANSAYSVVSSRTCDLARPVVTAGNSTVSGKPTLTWKAVAGAKEYKIYRSTSENGTYSLINTTPDTSYTNAGAVAGTKYYYKVMAVHSNSVANSAYSAVVSRTCDLQKPSLTGGNSAVSGKPTLSWNAVSGAVKYEIFRATSASGTYTSLGTTTATAYTNTGAVGGTVYYYKVRAIHSNADANSDYSNVISRICRLTKPVVTVGNSAVSGKPSLSWKAVAGAEKYEIYRATGEDGTYSLINTTTGTSYTNTGAELGKTYSYKVRAIHSNANANSDYSNAVSRICALTRPVVTVGNSATSGKPMLTWKAISGATGYRVYRATSETGTYSVINTTTDTTYVNSGAATGKTYWYKVVALYSDAAANSAYSAAKSGLSILATPVVTGGNSTVSGKPQLSWKAVTGATGYEIYRSESETGTYSLINTTTATSYTNTGAVKGKTYYYQVRALYTDAAANSAISKTVAVTCK